MSKPLSYAGPESYPPLWQRVVAWTMVGIATASILYAGYVASGLRSVLFMAH